MSLDGERISCLTINVFGSTFATCDVCEGAVPPWPVAKRKPSGAQRRLSTRNPAGTGSPLTGVCPRDTRMTVWLPHPPTYNVLPSFDISNPLGPAASVPGTFFHPVPVG